MYRVTLHHLDAAALSASTDFAICDRGKLSEADLTVLLQQFCALDPIENAYADPEIRIEQRGERHIVQTAKQKLLLYDGRNRDVPAQIVTPAELLAELSGSARATRPATPPAPPAEVETSSYIPPVMSPRSARWTFVLVAMLVILLSAIALVRRGAGESIIVAGETQSALDPVAAAATRPIGVFMSANGPGQHGIALAADGSVKLFRLNDRAAPSVLFDTFHLARQNQATVAVVENLGTVVALTNSDTVTYCGETFHRIP